MITSDGYSIEQYVTANRIVITLPQTADSMTNTMEPMSDRRQSLTDEEMATMLCMVKAWMRGES